MKDSIKTDHADLLNALYSMQRSPLYALRRGVLREAEALIVNLENRIKELEAGLAVTSQPAEPLLKHYCYAVIALYFGSHKGSTLCGGKDYSGEIAQCDKCKAKDKGSEQPVEPAVLAWGALQAIINAPIAADNTEAAQLKLIAVQALTSPSSKPITPSPQISDEEIRGTAEATAKNPLAISAADIPEFWDLRIGSIARNSGGFVDFMHIYSADGSHPQTLYRDPKPKQFWNEEDRQLHTPSPQISDEEIQDMAEVWIMTTPEKENKVLITDPIEAKRFRTMDGRSVIGYVQCKEDK